MESIYLQVHHLARPRSWPHPAPDHMRLLHVLVWTPWQFYTSMIIVHAIVLLRTLHLILILPIWRYTFISNPEWRIHCKVLGVDPHQNKCTVINTVVLEHDYRSPSSDQLGLQEVGYSINKGLSQSIEYVAGPWDRVCGTVTRRVGSYTSKPLTVSRPTQFSLLAAWKKKGLEYRPNESCQMLPSAKNSRAQNGSSA